MPEINIVNTHQDNVRWMHASTCKYLINNNVDVWKISVSSNLSLTDSFSAVLSQDEIARGNRFFYPRDRNRHIITHGALRQILGNYLNRAPSTIEFGVGINKKPFVIDNTGIYFNLSHSGDWILLAIGKSEVGVDTELIKRDFEYSDIVEGYFSKDEINFINTGKSAEGFYLLWTRKEALIKATGQGLDENIKAIPGLVGNYSLKPDILISPGHWLITSFNLNEQYIASLAINPTIEEINFLEADFTQWAFRSNS